MIRPGGAPNRAVEMAYRVLIRLQIKSLPVEPLAILRRCDDTLVMTQVEAAEQLDCSLETLEMTMRHADAVTFRQQTGGKARYLIVYREGGNPARLQFTLAHELGHRLLHTGDGTMEEEAEADCFASHLLCPRPALHCLLMREATLTTGQVARMLYVSSAMASRLKRDELVPVRKEIWEQVELLLHDWVDQVPIPEAQKGERPI